MANDIMLYNLIHLSRVPCTYAVEAHNQSPIQLTIVQLLLENLKKRVSLLCTLVQDLYIQYSSFHYGT
jgi:hypothetical protein